VEKIYFANGKDMDYEEFNKCLEKAIKVRQIYDYDEEQIVLRFYYDNLQQEILIEEIDESTPVKDKEIVMIRVEVSFEQWENIKSFVVVNKD
jgi:hypothetical protein